MRRRLRLTSSAALLVPMLFLAACSGGGIELNGKIFDAMGMSDIGAKKPDPIVSERADLVIPPSTVALPPPGSNTAVAQSVNDQLPNDPVKVAAAQKAAAQAERDKRCATERTKSNPEGPGDLKCRSIWTAIMGTDLEDSLETQPESATADSTASTSIFGTPSSSPKLKVVKGEVVN